MAGKMQYILPLTNSKHVPVEEVGAKASRLAEMMAEGFPVPDGWVITDEAFQAFCTFNTISCDKPEEAFGNVISGSFPNDLEKEILATFQNTFEGRRFAVRSSSSAEDGLRFSMAGQFDTFLNVNRTGILQAVKKCWASRFGQPVTAYLRKRQAVGVPSMGVIIQEQIKPEFSGVIFTLDPVNKSTDYLIVEWVQGLGEKLVSGKVVPQRAYLRRTSPALPENLPKELAAPLVLLRNFALDAEKLFRQPIDMEWCCDAEGLYILQSRPVTGLSGENEVAWTNTNMAENFPTPLAPFAWSVVDAFYTSYMKCALRLFGWGDADLVRVNGVLTTLNGVHCGRIYYNLNSWYEVMHFFPIGHWLSKFLDTYIGQKTIISFHPTGVAQKAHGPLKKVADLLLFWPRLMSTLKRAKKRLDRFEPEFYRQRARWRTRSDVRGTAKSHLDTLQDLFRFVDNHWGPPVSADLKVMVSTGLLEVLAGRWISKDVNALMAKMMQGIEVKSTEPSKLIWSMSRMIKKDEGLLRLLKDGNYDAIEQALHEEQRSLLFSFMEDFGGRCYHDCMIIFPTFEERHDLFWDLVKSYATAPENSSKEWNRDAADEREQYVKDCLKSLSFWKRFVFKQVLLSAQKATGLRERGRLLQSLLFGEFRRVALGLGKHLAQKDHLQHAEDIFYLQLAEIRDLVEGKFQFPETVSEIVSLRKKAYAEAEDAEPPEFFLTERGAYYKADHVFEQGPATCSLRGIGVSGGKKVGKVKVILDPASGHALQHGDILVTRTTDPGWTPLFFIAGGLILEKGGMLSHGAIVAREFGIPAIVDMQRATEILKDGEMIEIDGTTGTVTLLHEQMESNVHV